MVMIMTAATNYATRRATVEDLPQLLELWRLDQLPAEDLEKRFNEFQVVSDADGRVLAAIGIQIAGTQGWLHSEAIARQELANQFRELLWNRMQVLIRNHALERLWTQMNALWWRDQGFQCAEESILGSRPATFISTSDEDWNVKTLRAADANSLLDREFAQLKAAQQEETARVQRRTQWLKRVAHGVTVVVFLIVVAWALTLLRFGPQLFHKH
jgi:N-acetylglutamate synthase-like GNAT family acetyltransferase